MSTKRERHLKAIIEALEMLDEPTMIPRDRQERRAALAAAILDAIQDPPPKAKGRDADPAVGRIVALYCDVWRARHRSEKSPAIRPQDSRNLRTLVQSAGADRAAHLVQAYFAMPNGFYMQRRHPVDLLLRDLNAIQAFADGGGQITRAQGQSIDGQAGLESQVERIRRGEL